jgi:predicted metalloprotease
LFAYYPAVILADTETTWANLFQEQGRTYQEPRLVLFRDAVKSACGMAQSAADYVDLPHCHFYDCHANA